MERGLPSGLTTACSMYAADLPALPAKDLLQHREWHHNFHLFWQMMLERISFDALFERLEEAGVFEGIAYERDEITLMALARSVVEWFAKKRAAQA